MTWSQYQKFTFTQPCPDFKFHVWSLSKSEKTRRFILNWEPKIRQRGESFSWGDADGYHSGDPSSIFANWAHVVPQFIIRPMNSCMTHPKRNLRDVMVLGQDERWGTNLSKTCVKMLLRLVWHKALLSHCRKLSQLLRKLWWLGKSR